MNFLHIHQLSINLGEFHLQDINFVLEQGDYLTIIGPTGAGKTILLESIIGFWKPDQGRIELEGNDITYELPEKRQIGIVYQDYALLPHFTVAQNIAYGLKKKERHRERLDAKVREIAGLLNIDHLLHRKPGTLSGGEQQRVALSRALIVEPKLLLMDEPLSALDPQTRRETRQLIRQAIQKRGTTVIHITHDLDDAWALANKVAIFKQGQLLQFGQLDEVFDCPKSQFIADFVGATILEGVITTQQQGMSTISVNGFHLNSQDQAISGEKVHLAIRPENISITPEQPQPSAQYNVVAATLRQINKEGATSLLDLQAGETTLQALVANNTVHHLRLTPGMPVYAAIEPSHVRIVSPD